MVDAWMQASVGRGRGRRWLDRRDRTCYLVPPEQTQERGRQASAEDLVLARRRCLSEASREKSEGYSVLVCM